MKNQLPILRQCGDCQACCEHVAVRTFDKPAGVRCAHQCKAGCNVYGQRPSECATYQCSWLEGHGDDNDRPDRSGVIFETMCAGDDEGNVNFRLLLSFNTREISHDDLYALCERVVCKNVAVLISDWQSVASHDDADQAIAREVFHRMMTEPVLMGDGKTIRFCDAEN